MLMDVQQNLNPLVSVHLLHPSIDVTFKYNKIDTLPFLEFNCDWNLCDYKSVLSYLGNLNFLIFLNKNYINNSLDFFYNHQSCY